MTKIVAVLLLIMAAPMRTDSAEPERFELSIRRFGGTRIVIELRNASREAQEIAVLPRLYDGLVIATLEDGTTRSFMSTVFHRMLVTGDILWSYVVLQPGDYYRWEHNLSEFTEQRQAVSGRAVDQFGAPAPTLAGIAPLVVSVSTERDIHQLRSVGPGQREGYKSASLRSAQSNWPPK